MPLDPDLKSAIEAERRVLQALCQGTEQGSVHESARRLLANYRWREAIHQAIYQCVLTLPSDQPEAIRLELPARMTRMGFPDVAWEEFFTPHSLSKEEAERLMVRLRRRL